MAKRDLTRRRFLKSSGLAVAGAATVATLPDGHGVWAMSVAGLDQPVARALLRMTRLLYPHDGLSDDVYAEIVEHLAADKARAELLADGVRALDAARSKPWLDLAEPEQIAVMEELRDGEFLGTVQDAVVHALYDDPRLWALVGFQGSSLEFGGYINRGFDDIDWLPEDGE